MTRKSDRSAAVFSALSDPTRRQVVTYLSTKGSVTATELSQVLPVSRQAVSKHLASLSEAGLVTAESAGRERRYRLTPGPMGDAVSWMTSVGQEWDERLRRLAKQLESET